MNLIKYIFFIIELNLCFNFNESRKTRRKRFLIVPPTAPSRHQLIAGIGIPLPDLDFESIITGWVFKAQYFLPTAATDLYPSIFYPDKPTPLQGKRDIHNRTTSIIIDPITGEKYERYNVDAIDIETKLLNDNDIDYEQNENGGGDDDDEFEDDDNDRDNDENSYIPLKKQDTADELPGKLENTRWNLYQGLEEISKNKGFEGRSCVLRTICEAADATFTHKSGILGELVHILLTPSTTKEKLSKHSDNEYLKAEYLGKSGEPCEKIFSECETSLLDIFSGVYDPLLEQFKTIF